jgi:hypothetical protein
MLKIVMIGALLLSTSSIFAQDQFADGQAETIKPRRASYR